MATGHAYVLINHHLPGLVKIESTDGSPEARAKQLSGVGMPSPYLVAYSVKVTDAQEAERRIQRALESRGLRATPDGAFVTASSTEAIDALLIAVAGLTVEQAR